MKIFYSKQFKKHYKKRISPKPSLQKQFHSRFKLFMRDSASPLLEDHKLTGKLKSFRAFSITGNYRVVYRLEAEDIMVLIDVGTHPQVYGM